MIIKISMTKILIFVYLFSVIDAVELEDHLRNQTNIWNENALQIMDNLKNFEITVRHAHLEMYDVENSIRNSLFKNESVIALKETLKKLNQDGKDITECYLLLNDKLFELSSRLDKQIYQKVKNYATALQIDIPLIKKRLSTIIKNIQSNSEDNIKLCKTKFPSCYVPSYYVMSTVLTLETFTIYKNEFNHLKQQADEMLTNAELFGELKYTVIKPTEECYRRK